MEMTKQLIFEAPRFLRMACKDRTLRSEIETDTGTDITALEKKARSKSLNSNEYKALEVLFKVYVLNYDNYRKKYINA